MWGCGLASFPGFTLSLYCGLGTRVRPGNEASCGLLFMWLCCSNFSSSF